MPYFPFPRSRRRCFLIYLITIQWKAAETKVTFNEMPFEQSVLHIPLIMSAQQEALKWISLDWSKILYMVLWILYMVPLYNIFGLTSLRKRVIK